MLQLKYVFFGFFESIPTSQLSIIRVKLCGDCKPKKIQMVHKKKKPFDNQRNMYQLEAKRWDCIIYIKKKEKRFKPNFRLTYEYLQLQKRQDENAICLFGFPIFGLHLSQSKQRKKRTSSSATILSLTAKNTKLSTKYPYEAPSLRPIYMVSFQPRHHKKQPSKRYTCQHVQFISHYQTVFGNKPKWTPLIH